MGVVLILKNGSVICRVTVNFPLVHNTLVERSLLLVFCSGRGLLGSYDIVAVLCTVLC